MTGREINAEDITIGNLFNAQSLARIASSTWERMWDKFLAFGTASAGLIGIIILGRLVKLLIDTIIHGYALYSLYGFSIHMLGAIWNSVTQLLIYLGQKDKERMENEKNEETEKSLEIKTIDENKDESKLASEEETRKLYPHLYVPNSNSL
jgi:hypothetical protein